MKMKNLNLMEMRMRIEIINGVEVGESKILPKFDQLPSLTRKMLPRILVIVLIFLNIKQNKNN